MAGFISRLIDFSYRQANRLIPSDITFVLVATGAQANTLSDHLNDVNHLDHVNHVAQPGTHERASAGTSDTLFEYRLLALPELRALQDQPQYEISAALCDEMTGEGYACYGALLDGRVAGYLWCGVGKIPARHNSGGSRFQGIGLTLPDNTGYVFKCLVLPAYRGRQLLPQLLQYVVQNHVDVPQTDHWITTTDISNHAALTAFERSGFKRVAIAAECVIFGHHVFRTPVITMPDHQVVKLNRPV